MFTITNKLFYGLIIFLPSLVLGAESCNSLLNLGLYNVSQSSSSTDAQSLAKSTFCAFDYSRTDLTTGQSGSIEASYGMFSGTANAATSRSEIIQKQSSVCTSGFDSTKYSNTASTYSRTVYQGTLDAWNKCQQLANQGLVFEILPSSTLQGLSVVLTAPTGFTAKFLGVSQFGVGKSDCTTSVNGKLVNIGASTPFNMTAASKVTVNCARQMTAVGSDLVADAQDLVFVTSADTLTVPLAAIGNLARATVDQVTAKIRAIALADTRKSLGTLKNSVVAFNTVACPQGWVSYAEGNGRFIIGADANYPFGQTGGNYQHQLTIAEMPSHIHGADAISNYWIADSHAGGVGGPQMGSGWGFKVLVPGGPWPPGTGDGLKLQNPVGGNQPFSLLPPYKVLTLCRKL